MPDPEPKPDPFERVVELFDRYKGDFDVLADEYVEEMQDLICSVRGHKFVDGSKLRPPESDHCEYCRERAESLGYTRRDGTWRKGE